MTSIANIINIFMKRVNRPKVNILNGKVRTFRIGLKKKLMTPSMSPANARDAISPSNETPGNPVASQIPKIPTRIWNISRLIKAGSL